MLKKKVLYCLLQLVVHGAAAP